jgi:FkbM family methyltransferase
VRVFVDVGAHYGQTLEVALDPRWGFDRVFALEPAAVCLSLLRGFRDTHLTVQQIGLSDKTGSATLYGAGLLGGSVHPDKRQIELRSRQIREETIELVRASEWLGANVPSNAEVYIKLNCEGSECDILSDVLNAGLTGQIRGLYVDFDVRKVDRLAHQQQLVEERLTKAGVDYVTPQSLGCSGNDAVRKWLEKSGLNVQADFSSRIRYCLRLYAPLSIRVRMLASVLLPRTVFWWLGHRFGRMSRQARRAE